MPDPVDATIFLVDEDDVVRDSLKILLESHGMQVKEFRNTRDFLTQSGAVQSGCVVLGFHRLIMDGLDLMAALQRRNIRVPVIFIVGGGDEVQKRTVGRSGAAAYLARPIEEATLIRTIKSAIGGHADGSEVEQPPHQVR